MKKGIKIPFLHNEEIEKKANSFRDKIWDGSLPIDIERILDVKLKFDIIPVPNLYKLCGIDAMIASNWQFIYVDKLGFEDERCQNRLRFSLAHELGHFILHKDVYTSFGVEEFQDFLKLFEKISNKEYGYLEIQANKFANCFLLPRDILRVKREGLIKELKKDPLLKENILFQKIDEKTFNSYLAIPIAKIFNVSQQAACIALGDI